VSDRRGRLLVTGTVIGALVLGSLTPAFTTTTTVRLRLPGANIWRHATVCGTSTLFKSFPTGQVRFAGSVVPAPARDFRVRFVAKRCVNGIWTPLRHGTVAGSPYGSYSGQFSTALRVRGLVVTFFGGVRSQRRYFTTE